MGENAMKTGRETHLGRRDISKNVCIGVKVIKFMLFAA